MSLHWSKRIAKLGLAGRPVSPLLPTVLSYGPSVIERRGQIPLGEIYTIAQENNAVRKSIQTLGDYIFKEGWEWTPVWGRKCKICGEEYAPEAQPEACAECGSTEFEGPDDSKTEELQKFFNRVDRNGHTLMEVLKMFERHLNTADDGFLIVAKDYKLDTEGNIKGWDVKELVVADPRNFKMVMDPETATMGGSMWVCLRHRPISERLLRQNPNYEAGRVYKEPGNCEICGSRLYDVWYVSTPVGGTDEAAEYYLGDVVLEDGRIAREVIHSKKYSGDYDYGFSPIYSVYDKAMALTAMERYIRTFYEEERSPRAYLFIPTSNPASVRATLKAAEDKNVSQGGHYIPKITFDPGDRGNAGIQYIEASKLPQELQFAEYMDECYRRIGSAFGVAPVFHGNVDAVGMQNQGPTQWQITSLAASWGQWIYNEKVFPSLMEQFGVHTEWRLELVPTEEKDEMEREQVKLSQASFAQIMTTLGFKILGYSEDAGFEFSQTPQEDMFGGMGGGFGGMPGGMGGAPPGGVPPMGGQQPPQFGAEVEGEGDSF